MIKKIVDCALPGLATILGSTALCLVMTAGAHASPRDAWQFSEFPIPEQQLAIDLSPIAFTPSAVRRHITQASPGANQSSGSIVVLDLPKVADYWVSATRQSGGTIIFDGYAPNKSTRDALEAHKGADTQYLKLASGASAQYQAALDFGLSVLDQLDEGRFALRDNVVTFTGTASSDANYTAISEALFAKLPQGLVLARAEILPPIAEAYQWTATKASTGAIALTGMAPSPDAERAMLTYAGAGATETLSYASGEPDDFLASTQIGLNLLKAMSDGRVSFDGNGWTVSGTARSLTDKTKLEADFAEKQLAASGWSLAVGEPLNAVAQGTEPVPAAPATPAAAPIDPQYSFTATKSADGKIVLNGQIPADPARRYFGAVTKADIANVTVAPGAPTDFIPSAEAGIRALMLLPEAQLAFANGKWTLSGTATDAANRDAAQAIIPTTNQPAWTVSLALPAAPEPIAVATTPAVTAPAADPTPEEVTPAVSPPAPEIEPASAPTPVAPAATSAAVAPPARTAAAPTSSADVAACTAPLADFSARNAILFRSGAALIADDSAPALDELATDLSACPDAVVHIEGHTDGDGDDQRNLALSVARAEAVVNALVQRGVTPARLYAVGYGEAKPIADNDTPDGKRLNRRIVVTVSAEHY